jgi:hypothetical protein
VLRSALSLVTGFGIIIAGIFGLFASAFPDGDGVPSTAFMVFTAFFVFFVALVAGYATALVAGRSPLGHAAALGIGVVAAALAIMEGSGGFHATLFQVASVALCVTGVLLGGYLRSRRGAGPSRRIGMA